MVELKPLEASDKEQFIKDNQETFNYDALEEFAMRDNHFEEENQKLVTIYSTIQLFCAVLKILSSGVSSPISSGESGLCNFIFSRTSLESAFA